MMKTIMTWFQKTFPERRTNKEIIALIDRHEKVIRKASRAADIGIAALDGETGWWSCRCDPKEKECRHDIHSNSP